MELEREPHASMLAWHRRLIALRRGAPEFTDGRLDRVEARFSESEQWLTFRRGEYVIAVNLSTEPRVAPIPFPCALVLASDGNCITHEISVELPPDSVAILRNQGRSV